MVSALREEVAGRLLAFCWWQGSQIGVSAPPPRGRERRAVDPEALLLTSFEMGRLDPRLFDEMLDWLALNAGLVSSQRLKNIAVGAADSRLVAAVIAFWKGARPTAAKALEPLFTDLAVPDAPDPAFAGHGFARTTPVRTRRSSPPDARARANLAFRLRLVLGPGVRAEIMRLLLTTDATRLPSGILDAGAGYADRNVRAGLSQLVASGSVESTQVGGVRYYRASDAEWAGWRGASSFEWLQTLRAARETHRWLQDPRRDRQSAYLLASDARDLIRTLEADLRFAGIPIDGSLSPGVEYWPVFEEIVANLLSALDDRAAAQAGSRSAGIEPAGR